MQTATIKGEPRERVGRTGLGRLRKRGLVPAIIYGHKEIPEMVSLNQHDLLGALEQHARVIALEVSGATQQYLLKDVQFDHLQKDPLHVDLMRVDAEERVTVEVEIEFRGEPKGVRAGGVLVRPLKSLEIECSVLAIPDSIRAQVDQLEIGDSLHVSDLTLPEGCTTTAGDDEVVATVVPPREEEEAPESTEDAEASAEPEVIGRGKGEDEGDGE